MSAPAQDMKTQMALMNQKLDYLIEQTNVRGADHEARIRRLERNVYLMIASGGLAGGGTSWLITLLGG